MKKRNVIGAIVMAGLIVVSVPLGVNCSFDRLRDEAMGDYYYDDTGYAIYEGMEQQEAAARNLITVAERYVERFPDLDPYIDELTYRADYCEMLYEPGAEKEVESYRDLRAAAEKLSQQLEQIDLDEKDEKYPRQLIAQIESEQDKMERSSYNDNAREYNEKLAHSPVRFLAEPMGISPMGVFEEGSK